MSHMMLKENNHSVRAAIRAAFPHTLPVLAGFLVLGIAYGVLMQSKGYAVLWAVLMSMLAFCGSMQFVAITLLTTAFDPLQAFLLSLMVNARHIFYGISLLGKYKGLGKARFFLIYTLCDETFSIVSGIQPPDNINRKHFYLAVSLMDYGYWILGTFLGGVLGDMITFNTTGLDFALTALFVVLFLEQIRSEKNAALPADLLHAHNRSKRISAAVGLFCTLIALLLFGAENVVLPAMGLLLCVLLLLRRRLA